jgi:hypothetical protein
MATKEITPIQYADYLGQSVQNITKHLRAGNELAHVIEVKTYSRFYLLVVENSLKVNTIQQAIANFKKKNKKTS